MNSCAWSGVHERMSGRSTAAAPSAGEPLPAELGEYRLLEELGRGGMGVVYRAYDEQHKREVAIKVLSAERMHNPRALARFRREISAVTSLNHPHMVRAYHSDLVEGRQFLVMELIDGTDCSRLAKRGTTWTVWPPTSTANTAPKSSRPASGSKW